MKKRILIWIVLLAIVVVVFYGFNLFNVRTLSYSVGTPSLANVSVKSPSAQQDLDTDEINQSPEAQTAAVIKALTAPEPKYQVSSSTPQFVLLSFDGSKSVDMLNETLAFTHKMQAESKPLHFTYFINAAYFLTQQNAAALYQAPGQAKGASNIGFSYSVSEIPQRVSAFNTAFAEGNEIGSHSVGHYDGSTWSPDQWKQEFASFDSLMNNVQKNNPTQKIVAPTFLSGIRGFRAPFLGVGEGLYRTLGDLHFTYDASGVNAKDVWPTKDLYGTWHIPLGTVFVGANKSPVITMDYSLWMHQSQVKEVAVKGTPLWNTLYGDVESAYMNDFDQHYNGNRGPIVIGNHFTKWNDGVYWEAMKSFAENVCGKPEVKCVTFSELVNYLNTTGAPKVL